MATAGGHHTAWTRALHPLTAVHFLRWLLRLLEASNPMVQLRKMRDLERRIRRLTAGRDALICQALASGHSERQVGAAAGLGQARIHEIKVEGVGG
jgi:CRP-like cAMP-binding protein